MNVSKFDQSKMDAFGDQFVDMLNAGALALATSVGHRTGLFDTLAKLPPSTSDQIAEAASLNERYVREWLGAMVTGKFVEYDPDTLSYRLPPEHAAFLTRAATPDNLAVFAQYVSVLGGIEDKIVHCFRNGGGVSYAEFDRFHEVMAEDSGQTVVPALVEHILPLAPGLVARLEKGIDVLDVGCGSGRALVLMAKHFPAGRYVGYDFSREAIDNGNALAKSEGLANLTFEERDVTHLGTLEAYDLITTFDAVHDQADPAAVLAGIHAALRPDGVFLMQDIAGSSHVHKNMDHPIGPFLYTISFMHCMTVSLAQNGAGLGTMWGEETAIAMLKEAGFRQVDVKKLAHDIQNNFYVITK